MPDPKVFVFNPPEEGDAEHERMRRAGCALNYAKGSWSAGTGNTEAELAEMSVGADALIGNSMRYARVTREVMAAAPALRVVAKSSVGVDDVDVEAATELGILVCHAPTEVNCYGVAEGTVTMILAKLKKVRERDEAMLAGMWRDRALEGTYVARRTADDYPGITLGLIGLGRIARRVCQLFAPWNFRILACDPYVEDAVFARVGAERVDLETLLKEADVVSMHVVSTKETRGMMSSDQFALMKPDAIFVNTSRGDVVDEPALVRALEDDRIAGAALDVFVTEPLPANSPLRALGKKVMFSAHMVSMNEGGGISQGYQWATQAVLHALNGEVPDNVYNKEVIDRWSERFAGRRMLTVNEPFDTGFRHPGVPE